MALKPQEIKFLASPPQVVLQGIKSPLWGLMGMQKTLEIHLPQYEIPQPSPH